MFARSTGSARSILTKLVVAASLLAGLLGAAVPAHADSAPEPYLYGPGYWMASSDGGVFAYGQAAFYGGPSGSPLRKPVVSIAATSDGRGYWMTSADGGVFAYGNATFAGSAGGLTLRKPIVAMAPTPRGTGYWLLSSDGGVFAYGDAAFEGSAGGLALRKPIVGMAPTPSGLGYWLVASDGGVFAYGDAQFFGSPAALPLRSPIVSIASMPDGFGYWLVAADGGVFAYGDAGFYGSPAGAALRQPVVGISASPTGRGYWMAAADGGVFTYGDAGFYGSMAGRRLSGRVVGITGGYAPARVQQPPSAVLTSGSGYDISWPQCPDDSKPSPPYGFGIVGVTGGRAFTTNPCLSSQFDWARAEGSVAGLYVNLNSPGDDTDPARYGANTITQAIDYADWQGAHAPMWWLDVETTNHWSTDTGANARVVQGAIDQLRRRGYNVGIYSTGYQFRLIAGGYSPGVPTWLAGAPDTGTAASWCDGPGFGGGQPWLVQYRPGAFDPDIACQVAIDHASAIFDMVTAPLAPVFARAVPHTVQ